ncbi:GntR family transcriptional regulator [Amphibacillus jilinensis]|uniref:GntR family transcriptional regulator n=1 Tax=Amphibacillus jilinensis TaxID=1216008 RepID=UPI0002F15E3B|nr:GntR family transcriptional regulator [Amphibacillus jilinensis]
MDDYIDDIIKQVDLSNPRSLNESVYQGFKKSIIDGIIPVGERLNEKELSRRLNISRTPVREATKHLIEDKLVEYIPKRGVIVKKISKDDVIEIYKLRKNLDSLAAIEAMKHMTASDYQEFYKILDDTEKLWLNDKIDETIQMFRVFNEKVYSKSEMPRLKAIISELREYLKRFRIISLQDPERCKRALFEHRKMIILMEKGQKENLIELIHKHLDFSEKHIIIALENQMKGLKQPHVKS